MKRALQVLLAFALLQLNLLAGYLLYESAVNLSLFGLR